MSQSQNTKKKKVLKGHPRLKIRDIRVPNAAHVEGSKLWTKYSLAEKEICK